MNTKSILKLISLKGIMIPLSISVVLTTIFVLAHVEDLIDNNLNYFNPEESANHYFSALLFIGFSIYFTNKINLIYLLSNQQHQIGLIYKHGLILTLSVVYSFIHILIYKVAFLIMGLDMTVSEMILYLTRTVLFTFSTAFFFSFCLNLKNSYPILFLIYFAPLILKGIFSLLNNLTALNLIHYMPFDSTLVDSNFTWVFSLLIFAFLAHYTHRPYYIK